MRSEAYLKLLEALTCAWPPEERDSVLMAPESSYHASDQQAALRLEITLDLPNKTIRIDGGN